MDCAASRERCAFCGKPAHLRSKCPARQRFCYKCELRQSNVEKETSAIVEAVRKWTHYLLGRKFTIATDERSVTFMCSVKHLTKIKNEKVMRWRLRLSEFDFDIVYRPGKTNAAPDAFPCLLHRFSQKQAVWSARCSVPSWCDAFVSLRPFKKFALLYERR